MTNRLLNISQLGESNDPTPVRITVILIEILMVELYTFIQIVDFPPQNH